MLYLSDRSKHAIGFFNALFELESISSVLQVWWIWECKVLSLFKMIVNLLNFYLLLIRLLIMNYYIRHGLQSLFLLSFLTFQCVCYALPLCVHLNKVRNIFELPVFFQSKLRVQLIVKCWLRIPEATLLILDALVMTVAHSWLLRIIKIPIEYFLPLVEKPFNFLFILRIIRCFVWGFRFFRLPSLHVISQFFKVVCDLRQVKICLYFP